MSARVRVPVWLRRVPQGVVARVAHPLIRADAQGGTPAEALRALLTALRSEHGFDFAEIDLEITRGEG